MCKYILAIVTVFLFHLPAMASCHWEFPPNEPSRYVCEPDYNQILYSEPDWCLYAVNDTVFQDLNSGYWYVVPANQTAVSPFTRFCKGEVTNTCSVHWSECDL